MKVCDTSGSFVLLSSALNWWPAQSSQSSQSRKKRARTSAQPGPSSSSDPNDHSDDAVTVSDSDSDHDDSFQGAAATTQPPFNTTFSAAIPAAAPADSDAVCCICFTEASQPHVTRAHPPWTTSQQQLPNNSGPGPSSSSAPRITTVPEVGPLFKAGCGALYCTHCLCTLVYNADLHKVPNCSHPHHKQHPLDVTRDMALVLQSANLMQRFSQMKLRSDWQHVHMACPSCNTITKLGNYAKIMVCTQEGCVNPSYGYCVDCHKPIQSLPHRCMTMEERENKALLADYLARNGVYPCPGCQNAAEKIDKRDCNHMTCKCGVRYCGACGFQFKSNNYSHPNCPGIGICWIDKSHVGKVYNDILSQNHDQ